ncbi:hypothetical protein ACJIZ3_009871 [Penstemon smallii]|uniref:Uncharacterized protein n=1 Tax=Penstemon smallii TaxID=265156 RepID=A0ABD3TF90_9LAMI
MFYFRLRKFRILTTFSFLQVLTCIYL